jgi:hypothetical protein
MAEKVETMTGLDSQDAALTKRKWGLGLLLVAGLTGCQSQASNEQLDQWRKEAIEGVCKVVCVKR